MRTHYGVFLLTFLELLSLTWLLPSSSSSVALISPISSPTAGRSHMVTDEGLLQTAELVERSHTSIKVLTAHKHEGGVKAWGPPPLLEGDDKTKDEDCSEDEDQRQDEDEEEDCSDDDDDKGHSTDKKNADASPKEAEHDGCEQEEGQDQKAGHQSQVHHKTKAVNDVFHPAPSLLTPPRKGLALKGDSGRALAGMSAGAPIGDDHQQPKIGLPVDDSTASIETHRPDRTTASRHPHDTAASRSKTSRRLPECTEGVFPPGNATRRSIEEQRDHQDQQPCSPPPRSSARHSRMSYRRSNAMKSTAHCPRTSAHKSHRTATGTATATATKSDASPSSSWTQTMVTLADDTVLKKIDVWVPENEMPEQATRRLEKRQSSDGGMETTGHYADEVTAALGAFLRQDTVRPYLSMPHYLFIVSPNATTGSLNISTVYFESKDQVTHNQLHRIAVTATSGAPWPRWPGPRSRVKMTANATWIFLHIVPVLLLLWLRSLCAGKPDRMLIPAFWLLVLCEWFILMDHNTKLFFDVPLEDPQEDTWYALYFCQWALAISLGPSFFRWLDRCTGGRLKTHLKQHGPGIAMAAGLAAVMASVRAGRPATPSGRIVSDPAFTADVERMRARGRARARVDVPVYSVALPLEPLRPAAAVVPAPAGEEEQGASGRARRTVSAVS